MEIVRQQATTKADSDTFTGDAWIDMVVRGEVPSRVRLAIVRFAPGARNAWHAHALGQTIHVTEGIGRGGDVVELHAGDTVRTPPGEWHWHGAALDRFMTHLAIWEASDDGSETEWGDQVSDTEYAVKASPAAP
jgi:quercetin dioxygenase-like cupin family protein